MLNEMNVTDAAAHLNMKESTFRRICRDGKGPKARREGRSLRFLPTHLDEWADEYAQNAYTKTASKPTAVTGRGRKAKSLD